MSFLDRLIEASKADSPEFAKEWEEVEIGLKLALMRKNAGLTQHEVAKKMGIARPRIAELESHPGRCSFNRIRAYVKALGGEVRIEPRSGETDSDEIVPVTEVPQTFLEGFKLTPSVARKPLVVREKRKKG